MSRYKLTISYNGKEYFGFQRQKNKVSIQEILERVFSKTIGEEISIVASGRTDAGVSALEQVCHFDTTNEIDVVRIMGYSNSLLPLDIRVLTIEKTDNEFNARFNAKKKTYEYLFYVSKEIIPVYENFATCIGYNIDVDSMKEACTYFLGKHDFSSFCASNTQIADKVRIIYDISIAEINNGLYKLSITGNGFLYNMVRIIMGTLVAVGKNQINPKEITNLIKLEDRTKSGKTMPAKGLFLKKVEY